MSDQFVYCFTDIETDGPTPGKNSMLSMATVAYDENGNELDQFYASMHPMKDTSPNPKTLEWWKSFPETWARLCKDRVAPEVAMERYIAWIRSLPGKPMFAAHPLLFDGVWMDNYLRTYVNLQLFSGPLPVEELFVGAGIDVASYAHAALNLRFTERRPDYPPSVLGNTEHTHHPLEDAREHAAIFFNCREIIRKK